MSSTSTETAVSPPTTAQRNVLNTAIIVISAAVCAMGVYVYRLQVKVLLDVPGPNQSQILEYRYADPDGD